MVTPGSMETRQLREIRLDHSSRISSALSRPFPDILLMILTTSCSWTTVLRLVGLGIISHVAMPSFNVKVGGDAQQRIAQEILRSQGRRKLIDLQKIIDGKIVIQETKFNGLRKAAWANNIKIFKNGDVFWWSSIFRFPSTGRCSRRSSHYGEKRVSNVPMLRSLAGSRAHCF